jgi:hypothetical protein
LIINFCYHNKGVNPHHLLPPSPQNYFPQRPNVSTFNNAHQINPPLYFRPPNQPYDKFKKNKRGFIRHNEVTNNQYAYTSNQNLKNNSYSASPRFNLHSGYRTWHAPNNNNSNWSIANSTVCTSVNIIQCIIKLKLLIVNF